MPRRKRAGAGAHGDLAPGDGTDVRQVAHRAPPAAARVRSSVSSAPTRSTNTSSREGSPTSNRSTSCPVASAARRTACGSAPASTRSSVKSSPGRVTVTCGSAAEPGPVAVGRGRDANDLVPGRAPDLAGRASGDDAPVIDDRHGLAQRLRRVELVGAEDRASCRGPASPGMPAAACAAFTGIEPGEGLVHDEDVGVVEDGRDELDLLLVALRQALGGAVRVVADPEPAQPLLRVARGPVDAGSRTATRRTPAARGRACAGRGPRSSGM